MTQALSWSRVAGIYEGEFVDPFRADVVNPIHAALGAIKSRGRLVVGDLGCGIGPLLPTLSEQFKTVWAVDFAAGMLERARERCRGLTNIQFLQTSFLDLSALHGQLDVAVAVNSLVLPDVREFDQALAQIRLTLRPGGRFLGILPAMDGVHYCTMLLLDRALRSGKPLLSACKNAAQFGDHKFFDFAFGQFKFKGIEQHFWQPFEIPWRLERAGFSDIQLTKLHLSWEQFAFADELRDQPAPWDWFFECRRVE